MAKISIIACKISNIVLEIPIASGGNLESLLELKLEFVAYAISFIVCFNVSDFTYNLFNIVCKINYKIIWTLSLALFFLSLISYLSTYVAGNFHEFVPKFLYGMDFLIVSVCLIVSIYDEKD